MLYKKNFVKKIKKNQKRISSRDSFKKFFKLSLFLKTFKFYIPSVWDVLILRDLVKNVYVLKFVNPSYYYQLAIPLEDSSISFANSPTVLTVVNIKTKPLFAVWLSSVSYIMHSFTLNSFQKLKFTGKGYYIYKSFKNTVAPQFGYSHRVYIYSFFNYIKFLSKTKLILFGLLKKDILKTSFAIKSKRRSNIFTNRGVRFSSQIIYKKTGKVSSYR